MDSAAVGAPLWEQLERMCAGLRARGLDIAITEVLDASRSVAQIDLSSRGELRAALRCTLVKDAHHGALFDEVFDRHFPARPTPGAERRADQLHDGKATDHDRDRAGEPGNGGTDQARATDIDLAAADDADLRLLADRLVDDHGGFDETVRTEKYHVYRILRAADLAALLRQAMRDADNAAERSELNARVEELRRLIVDAVRAHLAAVDPETVAGRVAHPFDIALAEATTTELDEMRRALRPLARKLAARLRHRRQNLQRGRLDMRATTRRSLSSGGVPLYPAYRRPRTHKPDVSVLCDVSGSVADVAGFTFTLISALADELDKTRLYAFVDAIDDITELVEASEYAIEPWQLLQHGKVIGHDGHSDYGTVLRSFWDDHGRHRLGPRSTVIIVGDARGNYRPHRAEVLGEIAARCRSVYWLNPEPRARWDTADSVQSVYSAHCAATFEVRTVNQLTRAVEAIL